MNFNSKEYAWIDVKVVFLGREVTGLRAIDYKSKRQKEALFATGHKPRAIQYGKREVDGTLTVLQSELIAMDNAAKAKGYDDITDVEFDVIISYLPKDGVITTDKIIGVSITEAPRNMKEGDLYSEHALPFIALDIETNII